MRMAINLIPDLGIFKTLGQKYFNISVIDWRHVKYCTETEWVEASFPIEHRPRNDQAGPKYTFSRHIKTVLFPDEGEFILPTTNVGA